MTKKIILLGSHETAWRDYHAALIQDIRITLMFQKQYLARCRLSRRGLSVSCKKRTNNELEI